MKYFLLLTLMAVSVNVSADTESENVAYEEAIQRVRDASAEAKLIKEQKAKEARERLETIKKAALEKMKERMRDSMKSELKAHYGMQFEPGEFTYSLLTIEDTIDMYGRSIYQLIINAAYEDETKVCELTYIKNILKKLKKDDSMKIQSHREIKYWSKDAKFKSQSVATERLRTSACTEIAID